MLALVDPALRGQVESVHDFRVAARSLRAALRVLSRRPEGPTVREARKGLRRAIRVLADVRDRDVGRALLLKMRTSSTVSSALKRRILGLAEADRRQALSRGGKGWPRGLDRRLIRLLRQSEPGLKAVIRRTRAEAWQQRRRALKLIGRLGRRYDPRSLHEVRIRVRRLRYALEVLAEVDSGAHTRLAVLKPLQSSLGNAQDHTVLAGWLEAHARRLQSTDSGLAEALSREAARFRARSRKSHAQFLKLRARKILEGLALHVDPHASPSRPEKGSR